MFRPRMFPVVVVSLLALVVSFVPGPAPALGQQFTPPAASPAIVQAVSTPGQPAMAVSAGNRTGSPNMPVQVDVWPRWPTQNSIVTVRVTCLPGSVCDYVGYIVNFTATWHFESGVQTCSGTGRLEASCSLNIGAAALGYRVNVDVVEAGGSKSTVSFTPVVDCSTVTAVSPSECRGLVALYENTSRGGWTNQNGWLTADTPCNWYGVTCVAGHVTALNLANNRLEGSLPAEMGNLVNLRRLDLSSNQLYGEIPPETGQLLNLQELNLSSSGLRGGLPPELGNLTSLQQLNLSANQLNGSLPPQFGTLVSLQQLNLSANQLSGRIPQEFGTLASLQALDVQSNQLAGCLPQSLTNLHALQRFHFDTGRLWTQDNPAFAAWYAGIPERSLGPTATCKSCYLAVVGR